MAWYQTVSNSNSLAQGDFIPDCAVIIPPPNLIPEQSYEFEVEFKKAIILTQSCDLERAETRIVLVCEYMTLTEYYSQLPESKNTVGGRKSALAQLQKGFQFSHHILNKCEEVGLNECIVISFNDVYGVDVNYLRQKALPLQNRIRLLSPYKEHLSQSFARYFMRVGLPQATDC